MNKKRIAGPAFAAVAVLLAVALVSLLFGGGGLVVDLTVALLGLGLLAGAILSIAEMGQRAYQLSRLGTGDVRDGHDVASLSSGTHWLRMESTVTAREATTAGVLDADSVVAATTEAAVRERLAGLPWPSTQSGAHFDVTDLVPTALDEATASVTLTAEDAGAGDGAEDNETADHEVRVVGDDRVTITADDAVSEHVRNALAARGVDVSSDVSRGAIFEHYVRVSEATVPDGATARIFGPFEVESRAGGETVLTPAGRFAIRPLLTTAGWSAVTRHVIGRIAVLALVAPLTGGCGLLLLWLAVPSLLG